MVKEAINNVIGLSAIQEAKELFSEISKDLSKDLGKVDNGPAQTFQKRKNEVLEEIEKANEENQETIEERDALKERIKLIRDEIGNIPDTSEYQKEINNRSEDKKKLEFQVIKKETEIASSLINEIPIALRAEREELYAELLHLKNNGSIPGVITSNLIDSIIDKKICICGSRYENSVKYEIDKLAVEVSNQNSDTSKLLDIYDSLNRISTNKNSTLGSKVEALDKLKEGIESIEREITELEAKIDNSNNADVQGLRERENELNLELESKIKKEVIYPFQEKEFLEAWNIWIEERAANNYKKYTERAEQGALPANCPG